MNEWIQTLKETKYPDEQPFKSGSEHFPEH